MKNWLWIPLAAVVGVVVGSWGPREDLKILEERMQEERTNRKASGSAGFDAFAKLANIPDVATRRGNPKSGTVAARTAPTNALAMTVAETSSATNNASAESPGAHPHRFRMSREDLRARIDEAVELWNTRVELARTQWKGKLGISGDDETAAFDSAISSMNEALRETMQTVADEIEESGRMTPELGLRLMGDVSRTMAEAYDAFGAIVPEDRRADVSEMPVFDFVDPSVAEPLIGVQDKLESGFGRMRR